MYRKPLISIAIPTYNRSSFLKNLLDHIVPEAKELGGMVQICISDNCSTDATQEIVAGFLQQYPDLIIYHKNQENLGHDKNVLKVMEMSLGQYVWLLGDDDMVIPRGLLKVIDTVNQYHNKSIGLLMLAHQSYFVDQAGKETVFFDTIDPLQPKNYPMDLKNIIGLRSLYSFLSVMLFNNEFLQKILTEEKEAITQAMGVGYIQVFIYQLMLLKYPHLQTFRCNEIIIKEEVHYYKFYIEDKFKLYYVSWRKFNGLILASPYMTDEYRGIVLDQQKKLRRRTMKEIVSMKAFGEFNYLSFGGCLLLFLREAPWFDSLPISLSFLLCAICPSFFLKYTYCLFVKMKYKKDWQKVWLQVSIVNGIMSKGTRRLVY